MPNDAKLGLVVGVGLVVAFAVVFFHKDTQPGAPPQGATTAVPREATPRPPNISRPAGRVQHTVKEGETLFSLARQYYGDAEKSLEIYRVNRSVLKAPDELAPGMVLELPDLPRPSSDP
jgi:nucleoid-associated protein YgaU